ncbi:MAG: SusC/RagA family TonB-linked outer membrane protein, partial [Ginsengibacter sp.]
HVIDNLTMAAGAHWDILPGLSFDPQVSMFNIYDNSWQFQPAYWDGPRTFVTSRAASASDYKWHQTQADAVFTYNKSFASVHNLNVKAGFSYFGRKVSTLSASGRNAATDLISTLNASGVPVAVSSSISDQVVLGYFSRINYDYKQKYLLSMNMRYDGASNLGEKHKWGFFPGISAGWNLHKENFWKIFPKDLLQLKLRGSYGVNGNIGALGDFTGQGEYGVNAIYGGVAAIQNTVLQNNDLQWERSKTVDVGLDVGIFNGRVNLLVDYYRRVTDNLITTLPLPQSTGFGNILTNLGSLENKGFEFELNGRITSNSSPFQWNISINAAKTTSKILKLPPNGAEHNRVGGVNVWNPKTKTYEWMGGLQEGGRIGDMYDRKQIGIYATDEEALGAPTDMYIPLADKTKYGGDVKWQDTDGNGIIDSRDQVYMGNMYPDWTGGFANSFSYKNFSLYARLDFTTGHTIFNWARLFFEANLIGDNNMTQRVVDRSWKKQGDIATMPRYYQNGFYVQHNNFSGSKTMASSEYEESGDFLAIREVTLSYSFPTKLLQRIRMNNLQLHVTGNNLHYFTKYLGLNPEDGGKDDGRYAMPKNIIFGASISF